MDVQNTITSYEKIVHLHVVTDILTYRTTYFGDGMGSSEGQSPPTPPQHSFKLAVAGVVSAYSFSIADRG